MEATFPHLPGWRNASFWLEGQAIAAKRSISGAETISPTMRGRWSMSGEVVVHGEAAYLQWQAFLAQMQGQIGTTLVPAISRFRPKDGDGLNTPFDIGAGFAGAQTWEHFAIQAAIPARVTLAAAAALRATELRLTLSDTTGIRPGQFFSIGERLHRVQAHWQTGETAHRVLIEPPLRAAAAAGTRLEIERPVCRMRFASETEGLFDQSLDVLPQVTVNLVEAL